MTCSRSCFLTIALCLLLLLGVMGTPQPLFLESDTAEQRLAAAHPLYLLIPRQRSQIVWYDAGRWILWALLGNDDDGIFGERVARFRPDLAPGLYRATLWALRNPLHNFCFYVIGSADRVNSGWKLLEIKDDGVNTFDYQPQADTVFAGKHSSFLLALHGGKPFFSLCWEWSQTHKTQFYFGWRCRGNFGVKCVL